MKCPVCGYTKCYQKAGFCRCGDYLINMDAYSGRRPVSVTHPDRTWLLTDGDWISFSEMVAVEEVLR